MEEYFMAGTSEGGRKAAQTRGHESLSKAGRKGGKKRAAQRSSGSRQKSEGSAGSRSGSKEENE